MLHASKCSLGHQENLPDHRSGVRNCLEAAGRIRAQTGGGERRLDGIGGSQVLPVGLREVIVADQALPVREQGRGGVLGLGQLVEDVDDLVIPTSRSRTGK
jgi:hypothetical protein